MARDTIQRCWFLFLKVQLVQHNCCLLLSLNNALCIVFLIIIIVVILVVNSCLLLLLLLLLMKEICYLLLLLTLTLKECCQTCLCTQTLQKSNKDPRIRCMTLLAMRGTHTFYRQSAYKGGKVVSPTHRPPLHPRGYRWYSFLLDNE